MGQAEAKGIIFKSAFDVIAQKYGPDKAQALRGAFSGPFGEALNINKILAIGWYPVTWQSELLGYLQTMVNVTPRALAFGGVAADFQERYINLAKDVDDPVGLHDFATRMVNRYYRGGNLEVELGRCSMALHMFDWDGFDAVLWEALQGGAQAALQACGAQGLECVRKPGLKLADSVIRLSWKTSVR